MNYYILLRILLFSLLAISIYFRINNFFFFDGLNIMDIVFFSSFIIILIILFVRKPFSWYLGVFFFLIAIYSVIQFEFFPITGGCPPTFITSEIYYSCSEAKLANWICNLFYYMPHVLYPTFLVLFLFNCKTRRYYKISCNTLRKNENILDTE
jgi:hypothetical protein